MSYLVKAVKKLKPTSEFVIFNNDYSTIEWHKLEGEPPTESEIESAIEEIKAEEIEESNAKATAKADLLEKLGISEDEAKLLLS